MSFLGWSIEPPLAYVVLAGFLYWYGGRSRRTPAEGLRTVAFLAGLATIVIALDSPIDHYADTLFWAHMTQHVLLLTLAPPLILLGQPWPRMWRALPRSWRTNLGRTLASSRAAAPLRRIARPWSAWLVFNGAIVVWHIPGAYDLTLSSGVVHQL